jgi:uncharacterized cupin superfamily protein
MVLDIEIFRQDWHQRGYSCGLWVDPPGQCWENYMHDTNELVMIIEGEVEFEIDGTLHRPAPGQELFIPAGALHSVSNRGASQARWLYGYGACENN